MGMGRERGRFRREGRFAFTLRLKLRIVRQREHADDD
jgi:hypothetical protein